MATRWRPDTCQCIIHIKNWDTNEIEFVEFRCSAHAAVSDQDILTTVWKNENQIKNSVQGLVQEELGISQEIDRKNGITKFSFDENRKLIMEVEGLTPQQKTSILSKIPGSISDKLQDITTKQNGK